MIPNNQWWFNMNGAGAVPPVELGFNAYELSTAVFPTNYWRDGLGLQSYNGRLKQFGGWNPAAFGTSTNEQYDSIDDGVTYTQIANAPWSVRHLMGQGIINNSYFTNRIIICGGDDFNGVLKDVWTFDDVNGWLQITADWGVGVGQRVVFASCVHQGWLYIAGGQDVVNSPTPTMKTDVWKTEDGINFVFVANLPMSHFSAGQIISDGTGIVFLGGARYLPTVSDNYNSTVYRLNTTTNIFTATGTLPVDMISLYPNCSYYKDRIFFQSGYSAVNPTANIYGNVKGMHWSDDLGTTWTEVLSAEAAHASALVIHNDELHSLSGNYNNRSWKTVGVPLPARNPILIDTWYNNITTIKPSPNSITRLNNFVTELDNAGQITLLDLFYLVSGLETDEQRLKPLNTTSGDDCVLTTSVNYPLDYNGAFFNGGYIDTKWNVFDDGVVSSQNDAYMSVFITTDNANNGADAGAICANSTECSILAWYSDNKNYSAANNAVGEVLVATTSSLGYRAIERTNSNDLTLVVNTTSTALTSASGTPQSADLYLASINNNGTPIAPGTRRQTILLFGKSGVNHAAIRTAILNYLTAAGVALS